MSKESKKLKREFNLAQVANLDLEKKVAELVEALKKCQDEKRVAEDEKKAAQGALENSKKDLEKLQNTHEEDLKLIENLRKDHDKSSNVAEDLYVNNADLAKTLSAKEQKIQDLERALAERDEASGQEVTRIMTKLKLLFEEYRNTLRDFGVCPAPFPVNEEISGFMDWINNEFKALPGVISGANDFAAAFSAESILMLLHDLTVRTSRSFMRNLCIFLMPRALQSSASMKMCRLSSSSSRENSGSLARRRLQRRSLTLNWIRLVSWRCRWFFKTSRIFFFGFLSLLFPLVLF
jgi:hypothetical protein